MDTNWGRYLEWVFNIHFMVLFGKDGNRTIAFFVHRIGSVVNVCHLMHLCEGASETEVSFLRLWMVFPGQESQDFPAAASSIYSPAFWVWRISHGIGNFLMSLGNSWITELGSHVQFPGTWGLLGQWWKLPSQKSIAPVAAQRSSLRINSSLL